MDNGMLKKADAATAGLHPEHMLRFLSMIEENNLHIHSFALVRHGCIIAEGAYTPYRRDRNHMLQSCSKTFTAIATGFAVQENLLKKEDSIAKFFPDIYIRDEKMKQITVQDLLTMQTGHHDDTSGLFANVERDWEELFFETEITHKPGTYFVYNTPATYMLSVIIQIVSGETLFEYLKSRLFKPLGFSKDIYWEKSPNGHSIGGFGLNITNEDLLKFGMFLLGKGSYNGKQLLNSEWIKECTYPWADSSANGKPDWSQGYGYQCWCCVPENVFRGDGAFGQFCIVMPDQDAVFVVNSGMDNDGTEKFLTLFWEEVFEHFTEPLSVDNQMIQCQRELEDKLSSLSLTPYFRQEGHDCRKVEFDSFVHGRKYVFEKNLFRIESLQIIENQGKYEMMIEIDGMESRLPLQNGKWTEIELSLKEQIENPTWALTFIPGVVYKEAAVQACAEKDMLYVDIAFLNGALQDALRLKFKEDLVDVHIRRVVGMPPVEITVCGKMLEN